MRQLILFALFIFWGYLACAQKIDAKYVKALEKQYQPLKSDFCKGCKLWVNPYFKAIIDTFNRESKVTYGYFDKKRDSLVSVLKIERKGIYASWHPAYGYPNEDKFYTTINKGIKKVSLKYAKGHYAAWILCAWAVDGVLLSDTYDFNEGIEIQAQNEGTELEVEYLTRALVGNKSAAKRIKYSGPTFDRVDYWKGSWGSNRIFEVAGIRKNYSAVYWNLLNYGNEYHAFWFPNDISASKGYLNYRIDVDNNNPNKLGLIQRLGFDPRKIFTVSNK